MLGSGAQPARRKTVVSPDPEFCIIVVVILFDDLRERVYVGGSTALLALVRSGTIGTGAR